MGGIDFIQDIGLVMLVAALAAWICQRAGLPVVIGYLAAGVMISPHTHSFGLVSDTNRIQALAQVGLVFLIFNIGQGLTLQRLKRVGLPLIAGTLLIATFVLVGSRWVGAALNWSAEQSLVLAAILMVSSTAVLGKSLREAKQTHTTFGQTALTVTALDDLVAVVMLTVLASIAQTGGTEVGAVLGTILRMKAVIVAMLIAALMIVPPLLKRVTRGSAEVGALVIAGLLLSMALLSAKVGFSAALGAFLLGMIVSTTGKNEQAGKVLGALSDVFGPVFFVGMGMLLDLKILAASWPLVLGVLLLVFVLRIAAANIALLMVGQSIRDAARAAVCLTPIGEFSLILALTAVAGGTVPESFYAAAVGVCLFTAVTTPMLIRRSDEISRWMERRYPRAIMHLVALYHDWIESLKHRQNSSLVWRLTAPRVLQLVIHSLLVSGLLVFASPLYQWIEKWMGGPAQTGRTLSFVFWAVFLAFVAAPLLAIWRQVEALAMICAEAATQGHSRRSVLRPLFENILRAVMLFALGLWFATLFPYTALSTSGLLLLVVGTLAGVTFFGKKLIKLHSRFEIELRDQLADSPFSGDKLLPGWPARNGKSAMSLREIVLDAKSIAVGMKIADLPLRSRFECTIVRIERQGIIIPNPTPETVLYPNDQLLLLGTNENLLDAESWLNRLKPSNDLPQSPALSELSLGNLVVPNAFRHAGKSLGELAVGSHFGIQVIRIERPNQSVLNPGPLESLKPGDQLLVLGTPGQFSETAAWLSE